MFLTFSEKWHLNNENVFLSEADYIVRVVRKKSDLQKYKSKVICKRADMVRAKGKGFVTEKVKNGVYYKKYGRKGNNHETISKNCQ